MERHALIRVTSGSTQGSAADVAGRRELNDPFNCEWRKKCVFY